MRMYPGSEDEPVILLDPMDYEDAREEAKKDEEGSNCNHGRRHGQHDWSAVLHVADAWDEGTQERYEGVEWRSSAGGSLQGGCD